jgi:hypothetical protein
MDGKKESSYIKADNNIVINERHIRWIKKINECMEVCSKEDGCLSKINTIKVCKQYTPTSYDKLNKYFE